MNFKLTLPQPLQKRSVRLLFCCDSLALVAASIAPPGVHPLGYILKHKKILKRKKILRRVQTKKCRYEFLAMSTMQRTVCGYDKIRTSTEFV